MRERSRQKQEQLIQEKAVKLAEAIKFAEEQRKWKELPNAFQEVILPKNKNKRNKIGKLTNENLQKMVQVHPFFDYRLKPGYELK